MRIRLNDENQLFAGVVEVKLDLVTGGTDGFITSELKLLNKVLVGVLGHAATLIGIKENVIDVERSGNKRLSVSIGNLKRSAGGRSLCVDRADSEKALIESNLANLYIFLSYY